MGHAKGSENVMVGKRLLSLLGFEMIDQADEQAFELGTFGR